MNKSNSLSNNDDLCIGVITSVNGVKGYVKIRSFTENSRDIVAFKTIFDNNTNNQFKIKLISAKKDYIIAAIEGISSRNEAEKLRNTKLYISRDELPKLSDKQFYHADLIGMNVITTENINVGSVINLLNFGAGDILEIHSASTGKTIFYPFNNQFIKSINTPQKVIQVEALEEVIATDEWKLIS